MTILNDLMKRLHDAEAGVVTSVGPEVEVEVVPAKKTRNELEDRLNRTWDQIGVEQFIHDVPEDEVDRLIVIERCISARREEIKRAS